MTRDIVCEYCGSDDLELMNEYLYHCLDCGEYGDVEDANYGFEKIRKSPKKPELLDDPDEVDMEND